MESDTRYFKFSLCHSFSLDTLLELMPNLETLVIKSTLDIKFDIVQIISDCVPKLTIFYNDIELRQINGVESINILVNKLLTIYK